MAKHLATIYCEWNRQGKIEHTVKSDLFLAPEIELNLLGLTMTSY